MEVTENEFEELIQQSISIPDEDVTLTPLIVSEKESDILVQSYSPTPKHIDALITELQKPPQIVPVTTESPSKSDQEHSAHVLLQRKSKRRVPRPGVLITDLVQNVSTPIKPISMAQNTESTFTESSPDFESPIVEQKVLPSEGAQASGSSFEAPELDISKGKSKLPESEFVDADLLQNKVFDLEQSSTEKDLIIGKQDIRISELEKKKSIKDAKISELQ
uniref:Uncharacterized protein n=1 Tax=Lactuca sativa TaxID=4236 RepID=A0A9R1UV72_LACSA|nr:hypothetical protein LSAT_V11C800422420 [Lactuca sativa]